MNKCPSCGRNDGRHWVSCKMNRRARCERASAVLHGVCHFCWREIQKARKRAVAEKLASMDGEEGP